MIRKRRRYQPDRTAAEWCAKFRGYRVQAWGKNQVLDAEIEIWVRREGVNPNVWVARAYPGEHAPAAVAASAEDCMVGVALQFVNQTQPWVEFRWQGLAKCQLKRWNVEAIDSQRAG